ncbi:MAG: response regulator transcription factor [Chloroflexi bacterium]|nr:response regulator transcription factor [Chloroflexota bacterium]
MMPPSVLVVEDDRLHRVLLETNLTRAGYRAVVASSGEEALALLAREAVDLVLLDLQLPDVDGYEVCRRLREISRVPVIMVTARAGRQQKVRGLHLGADDYVTKPFDPEELLARVEAVLRRTGRLTARTIAAYRNGELEIALDRPRVLLRGKAVRCTKLEHRLVQLLARNAGQVFPQEELLHKVWGPGYEHETALLRTAVWRLRRKLEDDPTNPVYLLSYRGIGYLLAPPD